MSEEMTRKTFRAQAIELPTRTLPNWDVSDVKEALSQHEQGQLQQSALLSEAMDRDDRIKAVLDARIQGLLGLPMTFEAADESKDAKMLRDLVREQWDDWFPVGDLAQLIRWSLVAGVGLGEMLYELRERRLMPKLKVWHPQNLYWRWDMHNWFGGWQLSTQSGVFEPVTHLGKWLMLQPGGLRRPWMSGLVRSLAKPYLMRGYAYRDWARWSEVHGGGIKKAIVPSQAPETDKLVFFRSLQSLGSQGLIVLPRSETGGQHTAFDLDLLEANASDADGFQKLIEQTDTSIAISVLGQNLTTSVSGGSFAAAQVHNDVRHDLMAADAAMVMNAIRRQVLVPWAHMNFELGKLAPRVRFVVDPPEDQQKRAQTLQALAQAITALQQAKVPVDVEKLLEAAGVPLLAEAGREALSGNATSDPIFEEQHPRLQKGSGEHSGEFVKKDASGSTTSRERDGDERVEKPRQIDGGVQSSQEHQMSEPAKQPGRAPQDTVRLLTQQPGYRLLTQLEQEALREATLADPSMATDAEALLRQFHKDSGQDANTQGEELLMMLARHVLPGNVSVTVDPTFSTQEQIRFLRAVLEAFRSTVGKTLATSIANANRKIEIVQCATLPERAEASNGDAEKDSGAGDHTEDTMAVTESGQDGPIRILICPRRIDLHNDSEFTTKTTAAEIIVHEAGHACARARGQTPEQSNFAADYAQLAYRWETDQDPTREARHGPSSENAPEGRLRKPRVYRSGENPVADGLRDEKTDWSDVQIAKYRKTLPYSDPIPKSEDIFPPHQR